MIKNILLIAIVAAGFYGYHNYNQNDTGALPSIAPATKITDKAEAGVSQVKDFIMDALPQKETWPEPVKIMYYMAFIEDSITPIRRQKDYLPLDSLSMNLQHAVIAIEDHAFYQHSAISLDSIIRAFMINFNDGKVIQGGSTLTQQLVKNLFLSHEQTMTRKILEAMLALVMESKYTKDEILELYLNTTYFGMDCYGVNRACRKLFGKAPQSLKPEEAALLAGLPNAPTALNPFQNPQGAKKRQEAVLNAMQIYGYITQNQCRRAIAADIYLSNGSTISHVDNMAF